MKRIHSLKFFCHTVTIVTMIFVGLCIKSTSLFAQGNDNGEKCYILGFGSSFMEDMLTRVPDLLDADTSRFDFTFMLIWGGSLSDHLDLMSSDTPDYIRYHYNNSAQTWEKDTLRFSEIIDSHNWNIILLQQSAQYSGNFYSIQSDLKKVLQIINAHHPYAEHYWHLSWAFANGSTHPGFPMYDKSQEKMYYAIVSATSQIVRETFFNDFDGYIPVGTVIQTLRNSYLENDDDFCRDTYHIDLTMGRYAAACTFYESVLAPKLMKSVLNTEGIPQEDSIHTSDDYAFIRQTAYDVVHNDSLVWGNLTADRIYKANYYDPYGRPIYYEPYKWPRIARYFHVSGKKDGVSIIVKD